MELLEDSEVPKETSDGQTYNVTTKDLRKEILPEDTKGGRADFVRARNYYLRSRYIKGTRKNGQTSYPTR